MGTTTYDDIVCYFSLVPTGFGTVKRFMWRYERTAPRLYYGREIAPIIEAMPILHSCVSQPCILSSSLLQIIIFHMQYTVQAMTCQYKFEREQVNVDLDGRWHDTVVLQWLMRPDETGRCEHLRQGSKYETEVIMSVMGRG